MSFPWWLLGVELREQGGEESSCGWTQSRCGDTRGFSPTWWSCPVVQASNARRSLLLMGVLQRAPSRRPLQYVLQYFPYFLLLSKTYQKVELVESNENFKHGVIRMSQTNMRPEDNLAAVKNYDYPCIGFDLHRCAGCHIRLEAGWSVWNSVRSS